MAQLGWVYLDPQGGQHRIGLYHGDKTGHLLIHCNMRVIQVDFAVKETKGYSFFIEDELCEVKIYKEHGSYSYEFTTNRKVDTPLNRLRKAEDRRNLKYVLWFAAGLATLIGGVFLGLHQYGKWQERRGFVENSLLSPEALELQEKLTPQGKKAVAQLFFNTQGTERRVFYTFITADSVRTTGQFKVPKEGPFLLPTGFPLSDQDAFQVTYLPGNPRVHRIAFDVPSRSTITRYLQLAQTMEQQNHPNDSPEKIACVVLNAAAQSDWPVLAHFIFQGKLLEENARHNHDTYLRMTRDPGFEAMIKQECWDK
jgi:hypothetical protein